MITTFEYNLFWMFVHAIAGLLVVALITIPLIKDKDDRNTK